MPKFEDYYDALVVLIQKSRGRWILNSLGYMDFQDVTQKILLHIYEKWHKYDPEKPLEPWANTIIKNQMQNIYRDEYGNYAKPCANCVNNEGADLCSITSNNKQCEECPIYAKWKKKKEPAYHFKIAAEYEESVHVNAKIGNDIHSKMKASTIHNHMMSVLTGVERKIYDLSFVKGEEVEDIRRLLGYTNNQSSERYIKQMQGKIVKKVRQEIKEDNIDV